MTYTFHILSNIILTVTRFNNYTWEENKRWREKNDYKGCIYNVPVYITEKIPLLESLFVIEMNNDTNKIMGIGKIFNKIYVDKPYIIYDDRNYNRHTYKGKYRLDVNDIKDPYILEQIENLQQRLFKGKSHLKRGYGISQLTKELNKEYYILFTRDLLGEIPIPPSKESFHQGQH